MKGLRSIVPLGRDSMRGITVEPIEGEVPSLEWMNPRDLFVEEEYQRDVGENGTALIRRITGNFSWHKFKAPIGFRSAEHGDVTVLVDGQHTAIAAATRKIDSIPVLLIKNATTAARARAFVAHNRDRVALTMQAVFHAELAAGDPTSVAMHAACNAAGAKILTHAINLASERPIGETMAVGTIRSLLRKKGTDWLERVMRVLVAARRGPIKAQEIGAVSLVLEGAKRTPDIDDLLAKLIASKSAKQWASIAASETGSLPLALSTVWMRALNLRVAVAAPAPKPSGVAEARARELPRQPIARAADAMTDRVMYAAPADKPKPESVKPSAPIVKREPPAPRPAIILAQSNGITVTLAGAVARVGHGGGVHVGEVGAKMVSRLVTVMPAQLPFDRLASNVFGARPSARMLLDDLVASTNPALAQLGLEIFRVERSGYMLRPRG